MKHTLTKTLIAIAIFSAPFASYAAEEKANKQAYDLPTYKVEDIAALPEPYKNPIPSVKAQFVGLSLKVKFTVNEEGKPESVRLERPLSSYRDVERMTFANRMQDAVKRWRFEPAQDTDGNPIAVKVIMPVQVIEKKGSPTAIASLTLDTGKAES